MNPARPASGHPAEVGDGLGMDEPFDGFVAGDDRRQGDHRDDEQSGEVFDAAEPVGVAAGSGFCAERERNPERDRGQGVGEVVDGIRGQRDRSGDHHDGDLRDRRHAEHQQADFDRPDARGAGFQRAVDAVGGVMRVRREDLLDRAAQPRGWSWS